MNVFISLPFSGQPSYIVKKRIVDISETIKCHYKDLGWSQEIVIIDNYNHPELGKDAHRLMHLGRSIQQLSEAEIIFFSWDWVTAKGCKIEHKIAEEYGIPRIIMKEDTLI